MSEYEVAKDNYKSLVTRHQTPPNIIEVAQNHEVYDELNQGVEEREPLEWTREQYEPSELEEIAGAFSSNLDAQLDHWRLDMNSTIGDDVLDVVPLTQVTGVLNYEFEIRGYGTLESDFQIMFEYDESEPEAEIHARLNGEIEFEVPEHFSRSDEAAMQRNIEEDVIRVRNKIAETIEDLPQLEH